jgi:hypothetical protein
MGKAMIDLAPGTRYLRKKGPNRNLLYEVVSAKSDLNVQLRNLSTGREHRLNVQSLYRNYILFPTS